MTGILVLSGSGSPTPTRCSSSGNGSLEGARAELLSRWDADGLVKPSDVDAMAKAKLDRSLAEQTGDNREALAKRANAAANFVDFILDEYQEYYSGKYRYDFVKERSRRSTTRT